MPAFAPDPQSTAFRHRRTRSHSSIVRSFHRLLGIFTTSLASLSVAPSILAASPPSVLQLKQLSLDQLTAIEVTSVSRQSEQYEHAAAAITVVTAEHIERSGATTLPETLRWVPGLHVARRNANSWGVTSRGFSSTNSEKLLVLSDTRSIYTPLFAGVGWDAHDYMLADIERIEVIRGPGSTMWGSNAVNGVINITTKHAADTQGTRIETAIGTEERARFAARYGGRTENDIYYRVFGTYARRDASFNQAESDDDWEIGHAGFRADWSHAGEQTFTLQGDAYVGESGQLAPSIEVIGRPGPTGQLDARYSGANLLGRWQRPLSADSDIRVRAYYDWTQRDDPSFKDDLHTIDLDLQHRFRFAQNHEILWGANYRHMANSNHGRGILALRPESSRDQLFSAFIQDQIDLEGGVRLNLGTKWEHNDFSGTEWQPSVRAAWTPAEAHTVWAAVSRAARIPTRIERDIDVDVTEPGSNPAIRLVGNRGFEAEELIAFELGYRWRVARSAHLDLAIFDNRYDGLASLEMGDAFIDERDGRTVIPIRTFNLTDGRSRGAEALVTLSPLPTWRVATGYSYFHLSLDPGGLDLNRGEFYEGATPRHQLTVSSYLSLPYNLQLDGHFRAIGALRRLPEDPSGNGIPSYNELDVRLAWQVTEKLQLSLVGQNLLHKRHIEGGSPAARGAIQRGVYGKVAWDF